MLGTLTPTEVERCCRTASLAALAAAVAQSGMLDGDHRDVAAPRHSA